MATVPNAPQTPQLTGAPSSFTGSASPAAQYSLYGGPGYTAIANPYYNPSDALGDVNSNQTIYQYTGTPAPAATPAATAGGASGGGVAGGVPTGVGATTAANPWSLAAQNSAQAAGKVAGQQAGVNIGQGANMNAGANTLQGAASTVLNTGFDPQQALYNRTAQQTQDQTRVAEAARGITASPYGAGVEASAMNNFNIDWQNAQLGRQTQALGAAGTATNAAGTANTTGANLGQMGVTQTQDVGQLPLQDFTSQQGTNIQNWLAYMNQQNAQAGLAQSNYPNQVASQSMQNAGGVPFIPQSSTTFSLS